MAQEAFSDYHLYTLGRRTTINNNETKQVSMLSGTGVPTLKRYVVNGQAFYYRNAQYPGAPLKDVVQVFYQFKNERKGGLGMPMPAGTIRVYQADSKDGVHFVGEDRIDHTPKDETINIKIGNAFDVVSERKQTDFRKIATNVYESEYEITLRNHKATAVSVEVNEPIGGTWDMIRSSHQWTKTAAWAAQFTVPVAVDGTAVLQIPRASDLLAFSYQLSAISSQLSAVAVSLRLVSSSVTSVGGHFDGGMEWFLLAKGPPCLLIPVERADPIPPVRTSLRPGLDHRDRRIPSGASQDRHRSRFELFTKPSTPASTSSTTPGSTTMAKANNGWAGRLPTVETRCS